MTIKSGEATASALNSWYAL